MQKALLIERRDENVLRAIVLKKDPSDDFVSVADIAECEDEGDLHEWFRDKHPDCYYAIFEGKFECPDCLTVWEVAMMNA